MKYIEIEKDLIPYEFDITIAGKTFTFVVNYNAEKDFFTVDLYRNEQPIVLGEKIVYGRQLFASHLYTDIPDIPIIPYDLSENEDRVTWDNLNETVFLWLVDDDGDDE